MSKRTKLVIGVVALLLAGGTYIGFVEGVPLRPAGWDAKKDEELKKQPPGPLPGQGVTQSEREKKPEPKSYTEIASTSQSGKVSEKLTVDNTLVPVQFCDKTFKTRQVFIDGVDVVQRIAELATKGKMPKSPLGYDESAMTCKNMGGTRQGYLDVADVKEFSEGQPRRDGYYVRIASSLYVVYEDSGEIYLSSAYDGELIGPLGTLK